MITRMGGSDLAFEWDELNEMHIAEHGVTRDEAERVVENPRRGFPRKAGDRFLVWGKASGYFLQVVYVRRVESGVVRVIHARPLTDAEKRVYRRQ